MKIIIDTREQLPLSFTGHETIRRKLDEGDYATEETEHKIVIERKSLDDLYGSIIKGHARFKREILRAREKGKVFYIFIEGTLEDFYWLKWATRNIEIKPSTLQKIILTMRERYELQFIECATREEMSKKIVQLCTEQKNG
jgi:ERCC4-type nuclease